MQTNIDAREACRGGSCRAGLIHFCRPAISLLALGVALHAAPALAQDTPPPADTEAVGNDIVVTAQKRSERLQDVPIAITVVNNELLTNTNARNLSELQGVIPSANFGGTTGGGRTYVTLRGATGTASNAGDEPVAIYQDDVYLARGVVIGMADLLDVGSIEIVRGPQGTLQGRNATAGAILIRSADPTSTFEGRMVASIASPLEFRTQGSLSGPLGDGFAARIAAGYVNERGWANNTATGKHIAGGKSFQARGVLTYDGGNFSARIVGDWAKIISEPAIFRYALSNINPLPTGALVPTPTPNTPLTAAQRNEIFNNDNIALNPGFRSVIKAGGVSAKFTYSFPGIDLVSVTGYRKTDIHARNDSDGLATTDRQGYNLSNDNSRAFSQEVRLQSSGTTRFSWILGAYYFYEHQDSFQPLYNLRVTTANNLRTDYTDTMVTKSYAFFADATFKLTDTLSVIGGIRYTRDQKTLTGTIVANNLTSGAAPVTILAPPTSTWTDTSYRAKLVYRPTPNLMLFAGYSKGFRAGGFNLFAAQAPFDPESNKSAEIGAKGDLWDKRLSFSIAAYRNDYAGLQLRAGVPSGGAIITNAAEALIKGVEVEFTARPSPDIRITANGAYTDARFTNFPRAPDTLGAFVDASGNELPRTPEWQFFVSGAKDFAIAEGWTLTGEANYRWRDSVVFYFTNQTDQPWLDRAGGELGANLTVKTNDNRWRVSLYATNLTNARIINSATNTFSYPAVGLNKTRAIGLSVEHHF